MFPFCLGGSTLTIRGLWGLAMRIRMMLAWLTAVAALAQAGCATTWTQTTVSNPLIVPTSDFEAVWKASIEAVDPYFIIRTENRLARKIECDPASSGTLLEPWKHDTVAFMDRLEATLQTMRRFAIIYVNDAPGGGYLVKVEVYKELEDLARPDRQAGGRAVFTNDFPVNRTREIVGPVPLPVQWIPRGRDHKLEQVILNEIRKSLFL
jgi:hypothetical protein